MEKENKKSGLKVFLALVVALTLFFGGLFTGTLLQNREEEKIETKEPVEPGVYKYQINDSIETLQDIVNQNDKKEGEYIVEYKYTTKENEEKTYSIKFNWSNKLLEKPKLNILLNEKTIEHQCTDICYDEITFQIKPDYKYIIVYEKSDYMPLGVITVYNFDGEKVKEFNNVFDGYYLCEGGLIDNRRKNIDINTNFYPYTKYDNFFMVEDINLENVDANWFKTKGSILVIDWDTLETEKISDINACFSHQ